MRLNDPVSNFIPEFKGMKVAVAQERPPGPPGSPPAPQQFYTVPASREITIQDLLTHVSGLGSGPASSAEMRRNSERKEGDTAGRLHTQTRHYAARFSTRLALDL